MPGKQKSRPHSLKSRANAPPPMPGAGATPARDRQAEAAETELMERLLASAMGLPRVCVFKACRRRKRCVAAEPACLEHHRGLAKKRWRAAAAVFSGSGAKPAR